MDISTSVLLLIWPFQANLLDIWNSKKASNMKVPTSNLYEQWPSHYSNLKTMGSRLQPWSNNIHIVGIYIGQDLSSFAGFFNTPPSFHRLLPPTSTTTTRMDNSQRTTCQMPTWRTSVFKMNPLHQQFPNRVNKRRRRFCSWASLDRGRAR